jgi:hypothetical protein
LALSSSLLLILLLLVQNPFGKPTPPYRDLRQLKQFPLMVAIGLLSYYVIAPAACFGVICIIVNDPSQSQGGFGTQFGVSCALLGLYFLIGNSILPALAIGCGVLGRDKTLPSMR